MDFEEEVERLSAKYNIRYTRVYDLMTTIEFRLIMDNPIKSLFNMTPIRQKAYITTERYFAINHKQELKRFKKGIYYNY